MCGGAGKVVATSARRSAWAKTRRAFMMRMMAASTTYGRSSSARVACDERSEDVVKLVLRNRH